MDTPALPGDVLLDKYRVERVLGQGGMGIVVAARHVELGQLYAIKFLLPTMLDHHEALERFLREARAAAQLKSEHVARVHDVGRMKNGAPYMVMEYLDGCDLKVLLSREGPLPIDDALTYVLHVCDAISEAHGVGIIHRDLKPANLFLVHRRGGAACVKVLDFGISKHTGAEEVDLTNTNMSLGSPLYMSPEQMSKSKTVDGRSDIWALGVILYELLTSFSPFRAATLLEVASRVLQEEPRPMREIRPDVPVGLVAVVTRCLRKQRDERFSNVEDLSQALRAFVSRDAAARLPLASLTNAEIPRDPAVSTSDDVQVDAQTIRMGSSAPTGEPTSLTFGQTGKPKVKHKRHSSVAVLLGAVGLLAAVGVGLGWRASTVQEPAPNAAAAVNASFATASTSASASSSVSVVLDAPVRDEVVRGEEPMRAPDVSAASAAPEKPLQPPQNPKTPAVKVPATTTTTTTSSSPTTTRKRRTTAF